MRERDVVAQERWRISVDRDVCQGTGMCSSVAGRYFELSGGYSRALADEVDPDQDIVDAAEGCPVEAILVTAADDGRTIAPEPY
jgi:ferredoxin